MRTTAMLALVAVLASNAAGQTSFLFKLDGAQEVPAVQTSARGIALIELDAAQTQITCTVHHDVAGVTAAHIHLSPAGTNGGVVFPFASATSPISQTFTLGAGQAADLLAGNMYVNVHSMANPGGEIRGQIVNSFPSGVYISEYCNDPLGTVGLDTNGDGVAATTAQQSNDEFVEIVNGTGATVNIGGWTIADAVGVRHTFNVGLSLPPAGAITVFGGGSVNAFNVAGGSGVVADTGALGFNNGADSITVTSASNVVIDSVSWASGGPGDGDGESVARSPEATNGVLMRHTLLPGGQPHSAGFCIDGVTRFAQASLPPPVLPTYPGNGSDVAMTIRINGVVSNQASGQHNAMASDIISIQFDSPGGTLTNMPFLAAAQIFPTGSPPTAITLPGDSLGTVYMDLSSPVVMLADGISNPLALLNPVLDFYQVVGTLPPALAGSSSSVMLACLADDSGINLVNLGVADSQELIIQ